MAKAKYGFVLYVSDNEILISTPQGEEALIDAYFTEGGRYMEDYDRRVTVEEYCDIAARLSVG